MRCTSLTESEQSELLQAAAEAIDHGRHHAGPPLIDPAGYSAALRQPRASFVTLKRFGQLRGCIGSLTARRALVLDVTENAFAAAYRDPRFPPVTAAEIPDLQISLSLLTEPRPMEFESESDLIRQLRPGEDGLVLIDGPNRGTFLPSVWESLPDARDFVHELKRKAGLPRDYWSPTLSVERYHAEQVGDED